MSEHIDRKCRNARCSTYNLVVSTSATKCLGCGCDLNSADPFANVADLGDLFGVILGRKS